LAAAAGAFALVLAAAGEAALAGEAFLDGDDLEGEGEATLAGEAAALVAGDFLGGMVVVVGSGLQVVRSLNE